MKTLLHSMPHKVQDNLMATRLLSFNDSEGLEARATTYAKNLHMYTIVFAHVNTDRDQKAVRGAVCKGLCESSQYCPFSKEQQQPASSSQLEKLNKLRPRLVEDMEVGQVLDHLYQAEIADKHMQEVIRSKKTRRGRVDALLSFIHHTHSKAQDTFMDILKKTNWWIFEDEID